MPGISWEYRVSQFSRDGTRTVFQEAEAVRVNKGKKKLASWAKVETGGWWRRKSISDWLRSLKHLKI